jgi:hypothetical protein
MTDSLIGHTLKPNYPTSDTLVAYRYLLNGEAGELFLIGIPDLIVIEDLTICRAYFVCKFISDGWGQRVAADIRAVINDVKANYLIDETKHNEFTRHGYGKTGFEWL